MAAKKDYSGACRQHYEYATTGKVPNQSTGKGSPSNGENYKKGGRATKKGARR